MAKNKSPFTTHNSQLMQNFVIFQTADGKVNIDVYFQNETLWLPQRLIAELFEKGRSTIAGHLKKIFDDGELDEKVVCRNFRQTTQHGAIEGKTQEKEVKFYNLRAITALGYRLNEEHIKLLEQIVTAYLDLAESRARNRTVMNMKDWDKFLVQFLELADYPILKDVGKISMLEAKLKAESEYDKYRVIQDENYISDFDREIKKMIEKKTIEN